MYKAALFDLDGTLAHTFSDISRSVNLFLEQEGYPLRSQEDLLSFISYGRRDFIRHALPSPVCDEELDRLVAVYTEIYRLHYMDTTMPYLGMVELIGKLRAAGYRTAVVTNKAHANALHMVNTLFPAGSFDGIWGLSHFAPKPDPAIALEAARILAVSPTDCVFIGDSELDIATAQNAEMTPIGVAWGYRAESILQQAGATAIAHSMEELEALLLS